MSFWLDLFAGRRYPSAYEPLRCVPPDELAELGPDGDDARDERLTATEERLGATVQSASVT